MVLIWDGYPVYVAHAWGNIGVKSFANLRILSISPNTLNKCILPVLSDISTILCYFFFYCSYVRLLLKLLRTHCTRLKENRLFIIVVNFNKYLVEIQLSYFLRPSAHRDLSNNHNIRSMVFPRCPKHCVSASDINFSKRSFNHSAYIIWYLRKRRARKAQSLSFDLFNALD